MSLIKIVRHLVEWPWKCSSSATKVGDALFLSPLQVNNHRTCFEIVDSFEKWDLITSFPDVQAIWEFCCFFSLENYVQMVHHSQVMSRFAQLHQLLGFLVYLSYVFHFMLASVASICHETWGPWMVNPNHESLMRVGLQQSPRVQPWWRSGGEVPLKLAEFYIWDAQRTFKNFEV